MVFPWHTFWGGARRDYLRYLSISHGPDPAGSHSLSEKEVTEIKVRFGREKETKNTVRGTFYFQKWFAADFKELTITIEKENRA